MRTTEKKTINKRRKTRIERREERMARRKSEKQNWKWRPMQGITSVEFSLGSESLSLALRMKML
jgi:hypothetical protein